MPDATDTNVDGVEPTILVELLDVPHNDGGARVSGEVVPVGVPTLVTNEQLVQLGAFAYRVVGDEDAEENESVEPTEPVSKVTQKPAEVVSPVSPQNLPGQSG